MPAAETRTKVTIFTGSYRVKGYIDLIPGARITDYMAEAKHFIALTDAVPDFCSRVQRDDVAFISLRQGPGHRRNGSLPFSAIWRRCG